MVPGPQWGLNYSTIFPILDGQAEWEHAQEEAKKAAEQFHYPPSSLEEVAEFQRLFGDQCSNPFFAQALAEQVSPEEMTRLLAVIEGFKGADQDEMLDGVCRFLGMAVVLSTGGMNADPSMAQMQEEYALVHDGLTTGTGAASTTWLRLVWSSGKPQGTNTLYTAEGAPVQPGTRQMEARFGYHYGYEYLATLLSSAGNTNSNLALGSGFFTGDHSLAHDIVAFDHAHGEEIARGGGYGNWGSHTPPGGDRRTV